MSPPTSAGTASKATEAPANARSVQILVFQVGPMRLGLSIDHISYLIRMVEITPVPRAPDYLEGVIDLRGQVVPILSLHALLALPCESDPLNMHIVIGVADSKTVGLTVESVSDLRQVASDRLQKPGRNETASELISTVARLDDGLVFLLDFEKVASLVDRSDWQAAASIVPASGSRAEVPPETQRVLHQRAAELRHAVAEEEVELRGFLTFSLGNERYAVDRQHVERILQVPDIAPVPGAPEYFAGLINFAGDICWVVDVKKLLNLPKTLAGNEERIVVVNYGGARFGFLADSVSNVTNVPVSAIRPTGDSAERAKDNYVAEEIYWQDELIGVLDLSPLCLQNGNASGRGSATP